MGHRKPDVTIVNDEPDCKFNCFEPAQLEQLWGRKPDITIVNNEPDCKYNCYEPAQQLQQLAQQYNVKAVLLI